MGSVRFNLLFGIVLAIASLWMTIESVQRSEWLSAILALLVGGIFVHSAWKDFKTLREPPKTT